MGRDQDRHHDRLEHHQGVVDGGIERHRTAATTTSGTHPHGRREPGHLGRLRSPDRARKDGLKGGSTSRWSDIKSAASSASDTFKSNIVTPVGDAISSVKDVLGKGRTPDHVAQRIAPPTSRRLRSALAKPFIAAFGTMKDAVDPC